MGRSRTFLGDKDQISSAEGKRGKRGYGAEAQNEGYFCKIPIVQQDINFYLANCWSNFFSPTLQLGCPKTYMQGLSSDFKQFL